VWLPQASCLFPWAWLCSSPWHALNHHGLTGLGLIFPNWDSAHSGCLSPLHISGAFISFCYAPSSLDSLPSGPWEHTVLMCLWDYLTSFLRAGTECYWSSDPQHRTHVRIRHISGWVRDCIHGVLGGLWAPQSSLAPPYQVCLGHVLFADLSFQEMAQGTSCLSLFQHKCDIICSVNLPWLLL
jgi:hypothetical protein